MTLLWRQGVQHASSKLSCQVVLTAEVVWNYISRPKILRHCRLSTFQHSILRLARAYLVHMLPSQFAQDLLELRGTMPLIPLLAYMRVSADCGCVIQTSLSPA